jgi:hypothetical protein
MISDPKLPFASNSADVEEAHAPRNSSVPLAMPVRSAPSAGGVWLRRIAVLFFVFLCATLGVMLMIIPWRPEWSDNPLLSNFPALRAFVANGFTRGLATGLGVLNVWIGFWEAIQYREDEY